VTRLRIPAHLAELARNDNPAFLDWVSRLPDTIPELVDRLGVRVGEPYEPGGYCSWVAPARNAAGEEVVLKVGWRHPESEHEADALRVWNGDGAVRVFASATLGDSDVLLLERCAPGTTLRSALPGAEQDVVVAGLLRRLWRTPPADHPFRPLWQMCDQWAAEAESAEIPDGVDRGLVREGIALLRSLPLATDDSVLLCTDLHGANILAARREPWLVIDPKPYLGDPAYDAVQHMLNREDRLAADPAGLARRMADLLDVDAKRVVLWLFARCVQQGLHEIAARLAP